MDMTWLDPLPKRRGGRRSPKVDYCVLVATVQAMQVATPTARAGARSGGDANAAAPADPPSPLTDILLGRQGWQEAVIAQGGSFNRAFARGMDEEG